jgi:predicted transcriptional regulator
MCKILISINPEHVQNILSGKKIFEYRKIRCRETVDSMVIYSTAPQMCVVAEASIDEIIVGDVVG